MSGLFGNLPNNNASLFGKNNNEGIFLGNSSNNKVIRFGYINDNNNSNNKGTTFCNNNNNVVISFGYVNNNNNINLIDNIINNIENSNHFEKEMKYEEDIYILTIEKKESSKIFMTCNLKDNAISLYDYSIEISLEEFYKKGNAFKQCNNIDEIYILLKNVIKGISISDIRYNSQKIESSSSIELKDNILCLVLEIPLLTKQKEEIEIQFIGVKKDVNNQFEILKNKYKSLTQLIYDKNYYYSQEDFNKFLKNLKSIIEEKEKI